MRSLRYISLDSHAAFMRPPFNYRNFLAMIIGGTIIKYIADRNMEG